MAVIVAAAVGSIPTTALTCLCISDDHRDPNADIAFMNEVVWVQDRTEPALPRLSSFGPQEYVDALFVVRQPLKNPRPFTLVTARTGTSCMVSFRKGEIYEVYGNERPDGRFATGTCSHAFVPAATACWWS